MTLVLSDGFDNQFQKSPYQVTNATWAEGEGIYGGGALKIPNNNTASVNWALFKISMTNFSVQTGHRVSFWMKSTARLAPSDLNGGVSITFGSFQNSSNMEELIILAPTGYLTILSSVNGLYSGGGVAGGPTPGINLLDGQWHHIYWAIRYSTTSTGYADIRVDDTATFQTTLAATAGGAAYTAHNGPIGFFINNLKTAVSGSLLIDDMTIWTDASNNDGFANNYIPPMRITTLRPSADTAQAESAPSTGSDRYVLLRKTDANGTNGYVTLAPGKKDLYQIDDLPVNSNVRGVILNMGYATANIGTKANVRIIVSSNSVLQNGNTYTTQSLSYVNPYMIGVALKDGHIALRDFGSSNIAWAQTSINSLQIGIENTGVP